jgi:hypothetical protein
MVARRMFQSNSLTSPSAAMAARLDAARLIIEAAFRLAKSESIVKCHAEYSAAE